MFTSSSRASCWLPPPPPPRAPECEVASRSERAKAAWRYACPCGKCAAGECACESGARASERAVLSGRKCYASEMQPIELIHLEA